MLHWVFLFQAFSLKEILWMSQYAWMDQKNFGRQPLKNVKVYGLPKQPYPYKFFEGCNPQILLGLFLSPLSTAIHNT